MPYGKETNLKKIRSSVLKAQHLNIGIPQQENRKKQRAGKFQNQHNYFPKLNWT